MNRLTLLALTALPTLVFACAGSRQHTKADEKDNAAESAAKDFDHSAADPKKTGSDVGSEVGASLEGAGADVTNKLGGGEAKDAGAKK
jgi:hypothetical protein